MKFVVNILKAFLINFLFIGLIHAATNCPSISPKLAGDGPTEQVEAILNDIVCSFIELKKQNNGTLSSTLNLTKKKIIPFIDLEYSTEIALDKYWSLLDKRQKKVFERDIKNSLINEYIKILADINQWEDITISVNKNFTQTDNTAKVKILVSLDKTKTKAYVTLKMINKDSWKLYV